MSRCANPSDLVASRAGVPTRSTFNDCFSRGRQANYIRDISSAVRCVCFLGRFSGGGRVGGGMAARCRVSVPAPGSAGLWEIYI